jgi:two-component system, sensor histidine kinase YesM
MLIILPLILMGVYLNNQFANLTLNKSSETALQTLKQTKQNFDPLAADTEDISRRLLSYEPIQRFTKGEYDKTLDYEKIYRDIYYWFDDVIGSKAYYNSVSIISGDEIILQRGKMDSSIDQLSVNHAIQLKGKGFWTVGSPKVLFYRAIMDFNQLGRMMGVVRFEISESMLHQFYKNINSYYGSNILLLDSTGMVLSSTARESIGLNVKQLDYIQKALEMKDGYFSAKINGARNVVLFYTVAQTNWTLIQTIPENSFTPIKTTINTVLIIAVTLCVLFGILFSLIQHNYLLKPLLQLRKEMNKLKTGNFKIVLDTGTNDEIGEINRGFIRMAGQLEETINDIYVTKIKQREAELTALEAQINPHFLYNTLDSIRWLAVKQKNYDVGDQIEALAEIFKHVLNKGEPLVTIGQELDFLNDYMFIQKAKYGKRIKLHIDFDPVLMDYKIPKLILQPLVENAILHGLEEKIDGGTIEIKIAKTEDDIRFIVTDNGVGTDESKIQYLMNDENQTKDVFALKNIDDRIKLSYGKNYGLSFSSKEMIGTRVEVRIPYIK